MACTLNVNKFAYFTSYMYKLYTLAYDYKRKQSLYRMSLGVQ